MPAEKGTFFGLPAIIAALLALVVVVVAAATPLHGNLLEKQRVCEGEEESAVQWRLLCSSPVVLHLILQQHTKRERLCSLLLDRLSAHTGSGRARWGLHA